MIIDANVYWFSEELFENPQMLDRFFMDIPRGYGTAGKLIERAGKKQIVIERPVGCPGVDYVQGDYTLEGMLAALDKAGIDKAVMKVPCCHEWMSLEICKLFNDGMADFARRSNGPTGRAGPLPPGPGHEGCAVVRPLRGSVSGRSGVRAAICQTQRTAYDRLRPPHPGASTE